MLGKTGYHYLLRYNSGLLEDEGPIWLCKHGEKENQIDCFCSCCAE